jgi:hypothetical protein
MARFLVSGAASHTPHRGKADLGPVLVDLCPNVRFSDSDIDGCYGRLGSIYGQWSSEQYRLEIAPIAKQLMQTSKELDAVARLLHGHETGIRKATEIQFVSQLIAALELDPTIGSRQRAESLIASLRTDAAKVAHACWFAASELKTRVGKDGRPRLEWYDDFTALLVEIAAVAGVEPTLNKDRDSGAPYGWLLDAAQSLETFLDPQMRSPDERSCFKRLERAQTVLKQRHLQNRPSA